MRFLAVILFFASCANAEDMLVVTIENHVFHPDKIEIPANHKFTFKVKNLDAAAEEFESPGLKVEKVVPAKGEVIIRLLPVAEGRYTFVGEYHEKTARGLAVVK